MNRRSLLGVPLLAMLVLAGCATTAPVGRADWPTLSVREWTTMTPAQVHRLIAGGADPNHRTAQGHTALMFAAELSTDPEVVNALIHLGAEPNAQARDGSTALMIAAHLNPRLAIVRALLSGGALPGATNTRGRTALDLVMEHGGPPLNAALLTQCEQTFQPTSTAWPVLTAAQWVQMDEPTLRAYLAGPNDLNARGPRGEHALLRAAQFSQDPQIITVLLDSGSSRTVRDARQWTAAVVAAIFNPNTEILQRLIDAGVGIETRSATGLTAFMLAAAANPNPEILRLLLAHGADIDAASDQGFTALMVAAALADQPAVIRILLSADADVHRRNRHGHTAWDLLQENQQLRETAAYWELRDAQLR